MKPLYHKNNLKINNINLPLIKIRDLLYSLREEKFPDEFYILNDIQSITIDLRKEKNMKTLSY